MAIAEKINVAMTPVIPKSESDIVDSIDTWLELTRQLEEMKPGYALPDPLILSK